MVAAASFCAEVVTWAYCRIHGRGDDLIDTPHRLCRQPLWLVIPIPVFDDVGGIGGYIDFLTTIHLNEDEEERGQAREWAGSLGWTGRAIKPQNLL